MTIPQNFKALIKGKIAQCSDRNIQPDIDCFSIIIWVALAILIKGIQMTYIVCLEWKCKFMRDSNAFRDSKNSHLLKVFELIWENF